MAYDNKHYLFSVGPDPGRAQPSLSQATIKVSVKAAFITRLNREFASNTHMAAGRRQNIHFQDHSHSCWQASHPYSYSIETRDVSSLPEGPLHRTVHKRTVGFLHSKPGREGKQNGSQALCNLISKMIPQSLLPYAIC